MSRLIRCALVPLTPGPRVLPAEAARYLLRVHRLHAGDEFLAFDPESRLEALALLTRDDPKQATCEISPPRPATLVSQLPVTLVQAVGKGDKVDQVIRDATQLGAQRIVIVESERSVPRAMGKLEGKHERHERIALESARQCGRGDLPELLGPLPFEKVPALAENASHKLCFDALGSETLKSALSSDLCEIVACIGPEGGFSDAERELLLCSGFRSVRLGPFILRTETAAIAALAAIAEYC